MNRQHFLALANGDIYYGQSCGAAANALGEVVFNTGMTGYQEIASDPSYAGQFVVLTTPEVGNYGCHADDMESRGLFLSGFLVHQLNPPSNFRATESLPDLFRRFEKPILSGIDVRRLVLVLREQGTQKAFLHASNEEISPDEAVRIARDWEGLDGKDYASEVSTSIPWSWSGSTCQKNIVAYDFGIKYNILRSLEAVGMKVKVVPASTSAQDILAMRPDGVFFSNGPGDPNAVVGAIEAAKQLLGQVPIFGICLGHQILSLACGARCSRLKFGHHGINHPVKNLIDGTVAVTSQNHNYAIDADSLPDSLEITHVNLNDGTVEGIRHRHYPMFSVQYHPEAAPGPLDALCLFKQFLAMTEG